MNADVNIIVSGPRRPDGLTDNERLPVLAPGRAAQRLLNSWKQERRAA